MASEFSRTLCFQKYKIQLEGLDSLNLIAKDGR